MRCVCCRGVVLALLFSLELTVGDFSSLPPGYENCQLMSTSADGRTSVLLVKQGTLLARRTSVDYDGSIGRLHLWQVVKMGRDVVESVYHPSGQLLACSVGRGDRARHVFKTIDQQVRQALMHATDGHQTNQSVVRQLRHLPDEHALFVNYENARYRCMSRHAHLRRRPQNVPTVSNFTNLPRVVSRERRDSGFIFPGTKWCGDGSEALSRPHIGHLAGTDRCCRHHDHCPLHIKGFSEHYDLFNYSFFTLSHCNCDLRFHTCLKMINTSAANMIGNIFFNVVRTKCFILKKKKKCVVKNWWGNQCAKFKSIKQASLKEPLYY